VLFVVLLSTSHWFNIMTFLTAVFSWFMFVSAGFLAVPALLVTVFSLCYLLSHTDCEESCRDD